MYYFCSATDEKRSVYKNRNPEVCLAAGTTGSNAANVGI